MLSSQLNISETRRLLSSLIHDLERHPDHVYRIMLRDHWVAEIKAPPQISKRGLAVQKLLALARRAPKRKRPQWRISEEVDKHLYGQ